MVDLPVTVASLRRYRDVRGWVEPEDRRPAILVQVLAYSAYAIMVLVVPGIAAPLASDFYFMALYANLALAALALAASPASTFVPPE